MVGAMPGASPTAHSAEDGAPYRTAIQPCCLAVNLRAKKNTDGGSPSVLYITILLPEKNHSALSSSLAPFLCREEIFTTMPVSANIAITFGRTMRSFPRLWRFHARSS